MDGVGWGGVVLICLTFLWPVISTALVYALKASSTPIKNKAAYWISSIIGGNALAFMVSTGLSSIGMKVLFSNEVAFIAITALSILISAAAPFGVALYMAKKCS